MRTFLCVLLCLCSIIVFGQRYEDNINFDWKFIRQDISGAQNIDFDDSGWEMVNLPHDASIAGPFVKDSLNSDRKNGFLPRQKGWYRKTLNIDQDLAGKNVFIEFEGIYRSAKIYINGAYIKTQLNGFESFEIDVTRHLKKGNNLIAVNYDNTDMESSRWYNGEGIYRDVILKITDKVYFINDGIFVSTPVISDQKALVKSEVEIKNDTEDLLLVELLSEIISPEGNVVASISDKSPVEGGAMFVYKKFITISNPILWSLEMPNLYQLKTTLKYGGKVADSQVTNFGIRSIEFTPEKGLLLNGKKTLVKGVNIHHDLGPLGAAAFERGFERRLEGLKKLGCNAIRLAHNPHDEFILDWCDRNGMLVYDEAFDKWDAQFFGKENSFDEHWKGSLKAFIRRDRNHPSVFIWSMGNETRDQKSEKRGFGVPRFTEMKDFTLTIDPTRAITVGLHPSRERGIYKNNDRYYNLGPPELVHVSDVASYNYREEFWPVDQEKYPDLIFILSEAQVGNLGNEWFNFNHNSAVGLFYWGGTDYIGESFGWPAKGWPNGIIDWNDHWKPFSYYIQSLFSSEPMVHIAGFDTASQTNKYWNEVNLKYQPLFSHWNWQGKDSVTLYTFSNCQQVELFLNGKSMGVKEVPEEYFTKEITGYNAEEFDPENPVNTGPALQKQLEWIIPYEPGSIKVVGRINGKEVATHELLTAGKAYKIVLSADREILQADGLDLSYITVSVVDKNGIVVPDAQHEIRFSLEGAGSIQAVGNADITSDESFVSDTRKVFQGVGMLVVRSGRQPGEIKVTAKAKELVSAGIVLQTE